MRSRRSIPTSTAAQPAPALEASKASAASPPKKKNMRRKVRHKLKKTSELGGTSKLTDEIEEEFCRLVRNQMSLVDACQWVGLNKVTVWEWRARGSREPETRYGQFYRAVDKALMVAKAYLIHGIAQASDVKGKIFILKNRYPEEFRDRIIQELSGPEGAPIPVQMNPFQVTIICQQEGQTEPDWKLREHVNGNGENHERP
jgi:hypothetical protein